MQYADFDFEFANLVLLDLAEERGRDLIHEAHVLWDFVVGYLALAEVLDLFLGSFSARSQAHPGGNNFA
jgi:hypothetical protein